jgi:hypothetical protein
MGISQDLNRIPHIIARAENAGKTISQAVNNKRIVRRFGQFMRKEKARISQ